MPVSLRDTRSYRSRPLTARCISSRSKRAMEVPHDSSASRSHAGLLTTIQDLGRPGHQSLGIPVGGALDSVGFRAANVLVGNPPGMGAMEVAYVGPTLVVEAPEVRLSFVGAAADIEILPHMKAVSGKRIDGMRSIRLRRGEVVRIGALSGGAVLYVGVEGGFDIEPVLGSVSTYMRGSIGGWQGRALLPGDRLPLRFSEASEADDREFAGLDLSPPDRFRVIVGPQNDYFSDAAMAAFFDAEYEIGAGADRMGMRLELVRVSSIASRSISLRTASHRGRYKYPATGSRSCCLPIARPSVVIRRSQR